ncbi:MAG: DMT family transporter [Prevotella sp.]|nr:DMT family transporter [Prevotella sp.]
MQNNTRLWGHLVAFIVVAIWGSTFVFTKLLLLSGLSPAHIFTLRFIIAYVLLLVFSLLQGRELGFGGKRLSIGKGRHRWFSDTWKDEVLMMGLGLTGGSMYFLTENEAMNYTTTTNTSLIVCLCPLFATALIGAVYKTERLRPRQMMGTVMAAVGVIVVVLNGHFVLHLSPLGDTLALCACLCWAVYSLLMIPANSRYDVVFITRKVFLYGLLSMVPYYLLVSNSLPSGGVGEVIQLLHNPSILANLLFLGCVASMICFVVWNWAMKTLGAVTATNYVYVNPITTILFAWLILSEKITIYFLLGTVLILTGMYLADHKGK